jgi:hypothetical protein
VSSAASAAIRRQILLVEAGNAGDSVMPHVTTEDFLVAAKEMKQSVNPL